jgi:hypothetical protein
MEPEGSLSHSQVPERSLSLRFPHQNPVDAALLPIRRTCPTHLILLDLKSITEVNNTKESSYYNHVYFNNKKPLIMHL